MFKIILLTLFEPQSIDFTECLNGFIFGFIHLCCALTNIIRFALFSISKRDALY